MNWKEWLERNAFVVVLGACVATGGAVAGVMHYYSEQELQITKAQNSSQTSELTTQLSSITRSMGHEEYLDVRKIVVPRTRAQAPSGSNYIRDADFYAPAVDADWVYSVSTETALMHQMVGGNVGQEEILRKLGSLAPIHLWRSKKTLTMTGGFAKNLFPYIYVERVSVEKVKSALGSLVSSDTAQAIPAPKQAQSQPGTNPTGNDPELDSLFRADVAGKFLTFFLVGNLMAEDASSSSELLNVQKVDNVVYVAIRRTLKDVTVQQTKYSRYYIYQKCIMISDGPDMVIIMTWIPSSDPSVSGDSRQYSEYVSSWLNNLRVLVG
jgi:hypothetical protein